jgi:hypothetical protein
LLVRFYFFQFCVHFFHQFTIFFHVQDILAIQTTPTLQVTTVLVTAEQARFDRVHEKVIEIWHFILHWENWKIFEDKVWPASACCQWQRC